MSFSSFRNKVFFFPFHRILYKKIDYRNIYHYYSTCRLYVEMKWNVSHIIICFLHQSAWHLWHCQIKQKLCPLLKWFPSLIEKLRLDTSSFRYACQFNPPPFSIYLLSSRLAITWEQLGSTILSQWSIFLTETTYMILFKIWKTLVKSFWKKTWFLHVFQAAPSW